MYILAFSLLIGFLLLHIWEKRRIINGMVLTAGIFLLVIAILLQLYAFDNQIVTIVTSAILLLLLSLLPFFVIGIAIMLILNGTNMVKKEGRRLANMLPMLAGFAVLIIVIGVLTVLLAHPDTWLENIVLGLLIIIAYVTFLLVSFLLSTIIYQYNGPRLNKDFIIVLGCGLKGKKVPQLLANRLDKAIQFHRKQQKKRGRTATFIVSGGKGPNEEIAEARAMQAYLIDKGIPKEQIFMEADSTNTEENMQFSKKLMNSIQKNFKSVFVTNNFHLFRASIYARKAGLDAQGIGGKTALYYLPTALLREFIAVLFLYRKAHITVLILLLAAFSIYVIAGHL